MAYPNLRRIVILNPRSRQGRALRQFERERSSWENLLGPFDLRLTRRPGDATEVVRSILDEKTADQIIVAGGDGTIHEAAQGYWDGERVSCPEIPLGIINLGSGGDYCRSVRVETPEYREALRTNRFALVDHGVMDRPGATPRLFLNIASVGMAGAMLAQRESSRFQAGAVAYFYHTVTSLLRFAPPEVSVRIETLEGEAYEDRFSLINLFACKGCYSGGGMMWAPGADLQSGALELTIVTGPRKWPLIQHSGKVYAGKIDEFPGTRQVRGRSVIIRSTSPLHVEGDGERWINEASGESEIEFSVRAASFPLVR